MKLTLNLIKPSDFFNGYFWQSEVKNEAEFKNAVEIYKQNLQINQNQSEKSIVANALKPFFENLKFNANSEYAQIGVSTQSAIDLALMKENQANVIIEAKQPGSNDFIEQTNANKKALHESILYYFRERENLNSSLKFIIITDFYNFYIFRASEFEWFYKNAKLKKLYQNFIDKNSLFKGNTSEFYKECEKILNSNEFLSRLANKHGSLFDENFESEAKPQIKALHLNINDFKPENPNKAKAFYKVFCKEFLLGEFSYDPNKISKKFYDELLYILGLKEDKNGVLSPNKIKGMLLENIFSKLESPNFDTAMQLIILWLNRLLFLKLIETNLLNFNSKAFQNGNLGDLKDLKFLNISKIPDFDTLHEVFFNILAKPLNDKNRQKSKFAYLPYLNSSIFSKHEIEKILGINELENNAKIAVYANTSLFDENHKKLTGEIAFLKYLFDFLDSFDFGDSVSRSENTAKSDLISSAVLGQVFERLNGYKDGSFYTPSFITSYMCKESINKIVLERFSAKFGTNLSNLDDLEDEIHRFIKKHTAENKKQAYAELNEIINSLKICDPAVGSGYFLVSALNYIIALKSKLGILTDENGKTLKAEIFYEFDELKICEIDGSVFKYFRPAHENEPNQTIQKTLFNEKAKLIENCLFGVDINPNSCEIARLRLWIELLKSSYFTEFDSNPLKSNSLETLPNIDINIKCGNSLVSYFELRKKFTIQNISHRIIQYKRAVNDYKNGFGDKNQISKEIKNLQETFKNICFANEKGEIIAKFKKARESYYQKYGVYLIKDDPKLAKGFFIDDFGYYEFDENDAKKDFEKLLKLYDETFSLDNLNPFEWRFEFPEILDENGDFIGFDLIIANPPYIRQEALKDQKSVLKSKFKIFCGTSDIYTYFFELGFNILKNGGILSFITSNKFFRASYGENLRDFMLKNTQIHSITDLNGLKVFDSAIVDTAITIFKKTKSDKKDTFKFSNPQTRYLKNAEILKIPQKSLSKESFIFLNPIEANLKAKIERIGTPLGKWDINIYRGILTGLNDAFIIDETTRDEILNGCESVVELERTKAIIKPILRGRDIKRYSYSWAGLYLINFHNGYDSFDGKKIPPLDINDFPSLKKHFDKFEPALTKRGDKGKTPYNLRNCAYLEEFEKEKIIYPCIQAKEPSFVYDDSKFYAPAPANIISGESDIVKILTGFLNSNFIYTIMRKFYMGGGIEGEFKTNNLEKLPIPQISKEKEAEFVNLVDKILEIKKEISKDNEIKLKVLENELENKIYALYELNGDEITTLKSLSLSLWQ